MRNGHLDIVTVHQRVLSSINHHHKVPDLLYLHGLSPGSQKGASNLSPDMWLLKYGYRTFSFRCSLLSSCLHFSNPHKSRLIFFIISITLEESNKISFYHLLKEILDNTSTS